jgi:uncharacterized lipoprotein YajG
MIEKPMIFGVKTLGILAAAALLTGCNDQSGSAVERKLAELNGRLYDPEAH